MEETRSEYTYRAFEKLNGNRDVVSADMQLLWHLRNMGVTEIRTVSNVEFVLTSQSPIWSSIEHFLHMGCGFRQCICARFVHVATLHIHNTTKSVEEEVLHRADCASRTGDWRGGEISLTPSFRERHSPLKHTGLHIARCTP